MVDLKISIFSGQQPEPLPPIFRVEVPCQNSSSTSLADANFSYISIKYVVHRVYIYGPFNIFQFATRLKGKALLAAQLLYR